ncbi:MAG: hypothetical protein KDC38_13600 [Planctomycetes bacterium]|nr:hypothetical protein [Planctomycetota bacterium]
MLATTLLALESAGFGQVHYFPDGRPWNQKAPSGPDAVVPGWYYNLGITGIRVELREEHPEWLLVRYVFSGSPASDAVKIDDWIIGANGARFETPHRNGYGMDRFGADGPVRDFAEALEASQGTEKKGRLSLRLRRGEEEIDVALNVSTRYGTFSPTFPMDCPKSDRILHELCESLVAHQRPDGSWGSPPHDTFAPLALLGCGDPKYLPAVEKCVRFHARTTKAVDESWLINWRYMAAAIVMSEYYLWAQSGEGADRGERSPTIDAKWLLPELQEVYDFLISSQYIELSQVDEKTKKERPQDLPKDALDSHGGWGHNPGFEGYGPICMLTGQGALAFALLSRCGIDVDRSRHDAAYAFIRRGTGPNGYTWYEDEVAGPQAWADMGRTGAAGIANALSPYAEKKYGDAALKHARVIGEHPASFPDTHGSPIMGMAFAAVAAHLDPPSFRKLMDANRWWFTLAQCPDGTYYYQPNRDNAGYGADSRISASAATAFILSLPKRGLVMTGRR